MKKIAYYTILFLLVLSCKIDEEHEISFTYDVTTDYIETAYNVNDEITINYNINSYYDFDKIPMQIKVYADKQSSIIKIDGETISNSRIYDALAKDEILFTPKEVGEHKITLEFKNNKGFEQKKEVFLRINNVPFNVSLETTDKQMFVGQKVNYSMKITTEENSVQNDFKIRFTKYVPNAPEKSKLFINQQEIELGVWYDIIDIYNINISTQSLLDGDRKWHFEVKNKSSMYEGVISQNINKETFNLEIEGINSKVVQYQNYQLKIKTESTFHFDETQYYAQIILDDIEAAHFYAWDEASQSSKKYTSGMEIPISYGLQNIAVNIRGTENFAMRVVVYTNSHKTEQSFNVEAEKFLAVFGFDYQGEHWRCGETAFFEGARDKWSEELRIKMNFEIEDEKKYDEYDMKIYWRRLTYDNREEKMERTLTVQQYLNAEKNDKDFFIVWSSGCNDSNTNGRIQSIKRGFEVKVIHRATNKVVFHSGWKPRWTY